MKLEFSKIISNMKPSEIRELLKYTSSPGIISFGGGMPNPLTFPIEELRKITEDILERSGKQALQYGTTSGMDGLLGEIVKLVRRTEGIETDEKNIIVTSGSQQALYSMGKIFGNPGDRVITEAPTYVGAISAFNANALMMDSVDLDEDGLRTDILQGKLDDLKANGTIPRFIYTIPNFQNPSGYTMSLERRKFLLDISQDYGIPIVEDNPYGELRYSGSRIKSLKSMDRNDSVIYLGTFSKVMAPGLRIGYVIGPTEVINKINLLKQALDLSTNTLSQFVAYEYLKRGVMERQIPLTVDLYRGKRDLMLAELESNFPEGSSWSKPDGGMFIWVTFEDGLNTTEMLKEAMKMNVAYVSGASFYPGREKTNSLRLNFTYSDDEQIRDGISRLSGVVSKWSGTIKTGF